MSSIRCSLQIFPHLSRKLKQGKLSFVTSRCFGDKLLESTELFSWKPSNPVKLRMEEKSPGNYPPILVQTMFENTVAKHRDRMAIVSSDEKLKWTFGQYEKEVKSAAKGFISLGKWENLIQVGKLCEIVWLSFRIK